MPAVDFKAIQPVPSASDFLDIILSKTQRKTPTVIHKGYAISRIRDFYTRKVKYTRDSFDERLGAIVSEFPRLEDTHPFYADLINVLYDRDHYKLALGQINTARHLIDSVAAEYVRLLKYGDSLYRCKQLKRAALGRMATILKGQKSSLGYLEQVRQHLSRLPSIDPSSRTLILCGFPNVGKSSFMNRVTRANVDVQPYAFTTKSLFVGHFDHRFLRWQVLDTPGILDHPLEERNTIEMQSITAMAHIRAAMLFFMDLSEECGRTVPEQVALFRSLRPLFVGKPALVVLNKTDLCRREQKSAEDLALIDALVEDFPQVEFAAVSCLTGEGVEEARDLACDRLLALRLEGKLARAGEQRVADAISRLRIAKPMKRDAQERPACPLPPQIAARKQQQAQEQRLLAKDIEVQNGGAGVYNVELRDSYLPFMANSEEAYDAIPEILAGKNIADFVDPEIEERLALLEAEEEAWISSGKYTEPTEEEREEERTLSSARRRMLAKKASAESRHRELTDGNKRVMHAERNPKRARRLMSRADVDSDASGDDAHAMDVDEQDGIRAIKAARIDRSQIRSNSTPKDRSVAGLRPSDLAKAEAVKHAAQKVRNLHGYRGEADRAVCASKPRHLFSGKRKSGTHDYR